MIRNTALSVALLCLLWPSSSADGASVQFHCAGLGALRSNVNLVTFNTLVAKPSTARFNAVALNRFSDLFSVAFHLPTNTPLLEPLISDFLETESAGAIFEPSASSLEPPLILGIRLDATRARLWQDTLAKLPLGTFWTQPLEDWLVIGTGPKPQFKSTADLKTLIPILNTEHSASPPAWLTAKIDHPPLLKSCHIDLTVTPKNDNFDASARVIFDASPGWQPIMWNLPTNLVRDPLVSFTAIRDLVAFVDARSRTFYLWPSIFRQLDANPLTNQFCAWAMGQMPFQTYLGWPLRNGNELAKFGVELTNRIDPRLKSYNGTQLVWLTNYQSLVWTGMRVVTPGMRAVEQTNQTFGIVSFFPINLAATHTSTNLWQQLNSSNIVYYDWERTGPRLEQWQLLWSILSFRSDRHARDLAELRAARESWLADFMPVGRTVTEVTYGGPNELDLFREGPIALTGIEIVLLTDWICEGPAFLSP